MHHWIDGKKFIDKESFSVFSIASKFSYPFTKNKYELNSGSHLSVIEEEELEDDIELHSKLLKDFILKRYYIQDGNSVFSVQTLNNLGKVESAKTITSFTPLVNINCLMNAEIKQKQPIWNSSFVNKLINRKNINEKLIKNNVQLKPKTIGDGKAKKIKKKKKTNKKNADASKNPNKGDKCDKKSKTNQDSVQTEPTSIQELKTKSEYTNFNAPLSFENFSIPSTNKTQRLTEFVERILNNQSENVTCDYCNETFKDVKELCEHKKQHKTKKEMCLLCEQVFENANEFTQHLLTHESVDSFSCKKCKKYFPTLDKYNEHCKKYHVITSIYFKNSGLSNEINYSLL